MKHLYVKLSDETVWPLPGELEWTMRYGDPTCGERMRAASIISAYKTIILATQKRRNQVVKELRANIKGTGPERTA